MRALCFDGTLRYRDDLPAPTPAPGEALVRTRLAGICNTDLEIMRGYLGFTGVLGHEFVGEVLQSAETPQTGRPEGGRRDQCQLWALCHLSARRPHALPPSAPRLASAGEMA